MLTKGSRNFRDEISKRQESRSRTSLSQKSFLDRTLDNYLYTSNCNNNDLIHNESILRGGYNMYTLCVCDVLVVLDEKVYLFVLFKLS